MCTLTLRNIHLPYTYSYITGLRRKLTGIRQKFSVATYCSHGTEQQTGVATTEHDDLIHIPVMVKQVLEALQPTNGQVLLDMTFGNGGHTKEILKQAPEVKIFCLDRDPLAYERALALSEIQPQIIPLLGKFSQIHELLQPYGYGKDSIDGALFDVGASSMQFDDNTRGFSLSHDGPLDMRMDRGRTDVVTAEDVVNSLNESGLYKILKRYGEEKKAKHIARAIVDSRYAFGRIKTTKQLAKIVASVFEGHSGRDKLYRQAHVATRTFQALRIFVNNELNELYNGLEIVHKLLRPGAPCVAVSFHSLEDRIIKRTFHGINMDAKINMGVAAQHRAGSRTYDREEMMAILHKEWDPIVKGAILPSDEEVAENPRARSAKLRAAWKM